MDSPVRGGGHRATRRFSASILIAALLAFTSFFLAWGFPGLFVSVPLLTPSTLTAQAIKGGTSIGYKLAYGGAALLILSQLYSLRKRAGVGWGRRLGSGRGWLRMHCFIDIVAATLILLHSGFPLSFTYADAFRYIHPSLGYKGLVGVQGLAAWLVLVSIVSGFFGRYLFARLDIGMRRWFRHWRRVHITISSLLYITAMIHLIIVVWFKYVSAV